VSALNLGVLAFAPFGFEMPLSVIVLGAIIGTMYGLLAVGIVLVYRSSRIINFAHGEIGLAAAAVMGLATHRWGLPYYVALPFSLGVGAGIGVLTEVVVIRRLRNAPRVMSIVATLGVGLSLVLISAVVYPQTGSSATFPSPPGLPQWEVGDLVITPAYTGMLVFGPLAVIALAWFLRRSRVGVGIRSAAANPEAARMAGIPTGQMSSVAWGLAGALSALTAILILPSGGYRTGESFGPSLLFIALTGAVVARMDSFGVALATGVGLGIVEQLILWNSSQSGVMELVEYGIVVVALLTQRRLSARREGGGNWFGVQGARPLPDAVARLREIRLAPWVLGAAGLVLALLLPTVVTNSTSVTLTSILCLAMVGVSVSIVTGLTGQLSLGQFAVAGVGTVVSYQVLRHTGSVVLAFLCAGLGAGVASLIVGLPALRLRGLMLAVTTLGFALVASKWLFEQSWMLGDGVDPGRVTIFGATLEPGKSYYHFVVGVTVAVVLIAHGVRRSNLGRRLVAVRENEDGARAFGISARRTKLEGFLVAGFLAGIAGAAYGHSLAFVDATAFPVTASINAVAAAVIGGMSLLVGPLLGALYIVGVPAFAPLDAAGLAATQIGWLVLILYLPGGLAQAIEPIRHRYVTWACRRHGIDFAAVARTSDPGGVGTFHPARDVTRVVPDRPNGEVLLTATNLRKRFGGIVAVDDVSFEAAQGEIVGLIGPNGAGKTTTFELLSGFSRSDAGRVVFDGQDISKYGPEARARLGLIRSFQDAALFPTMTVLDVARLAFVEPAPNRSLGRLLGLPGVRRDRDRGARELLAFMGLESFEAAQIRELSTGVRRITELACLVALRPRLLLLDEPSSGIAQRETEALGALLLRLRAELGLTMVIIEHDMPLIMGVADRIVAMDEGRVLAEGTPAMVRADPRVVEAYLGAVSTISAS
jgi:ABC-type branched-subunit amino acid transport system ATPase component/ABC-type branched-subunit amino acid transport system permease subunit